MFQSLFFWKWGFKFEYWLQSYIFLVGFNPCFSGSGVLRKTVEDALLSKKMFQSLFFWKWGFKYCISTLKLYFFCVSILVFLEVGF